MISDPERTLILRFARLKISSDAEADTLRDVAHSLHENHALMLARHIEQDGVLQLHFPGHCFSLDTEAELVALREACEYELRIWEKR